MADQNSFTAITIPILAKRGMVNPVGGETL
jgi:hypothetical protein